MYTLDPARKRSLPAVFLLLAPAIACSGSSDFTPSHAPDAGTDEDAGDNTNIVANPSHDAHEVGTSPAGFDATAGLPIVDASGPDAGVSDASGPDALLCPSMELACDGGCLDNGLLNCGGCGKACAMPANGTATCTASDAGFACGVSCSANFTHCAASCVDLQTDAKNCGGCGHDCLGGACTSGSCQPWLVTQASDNARFLWPDGPTLIRGEIASDGKNVVWIDPQQGILEISVFGGAIVDLVPFANPVTFASLAMANGHVAWNLSDSTVWTAEEDPRSPQRPKRVASLGPDASADFARDIALDPTGTTAYFIEDPGDRSYQGVLYRCDLTATSGNACSPLQNVPASPLTAPNNVMVIGSQVYWTDGANGSIWRADDSPFSPPFAVIKGQTYGPYSLVADSVYLYWAGVDSQSNFTISRAPLSNLTTATVEVLVPVTNGRMTVLAVDTTNLYFDGLNTNTLDYIPFPPSGTAPGGVPARSLPVTTPFALALAEGALYWMDINNKINGIRFP